MVDVVDIKDKGKGLVATKSFAAGDHVAIYASKSVEKSAITIQNFKHSYYGNGLYFIGDDVGRYANDGMSPSLLQKLHRTVSVESVRNWATDYLHTVICSNVIPTHINGKLILVAIRHIAAGDEIQWHYSSEYWMDEVALDSNSKPRVRLACCLSMADHKYGSDLLTQIFPMVDKFGRYACMIHGEQKKPTDAEIKNAATKLEAAFRLKDWTIECLISRCMWPNAEQYKMDLPSCIHCGELNPPAKCKKCPAKYCDAICQKAHWPIHKAFCQI